MIRTLSPSLQMSRRQALLAAASFGGAAALTACGPATKIVEGTVSAVIAAFLLEWFKPSAMQMNNTTGTSDFNDAPPLAQSFVSAVEKPYRMAKEAKDVIAEFRAGQHMLLRPGDTIIARGNGRLDMTVFLKPDDVPQDILDLGDVFGVTYKLVPADGGEPKSAKTRLVRREDLYDNQGPISLVEPMFEDSPPLIEPGLYKPVIVFSLDGTEGYNLYPRGYASTPVAVFGDDEFARGLDQGAWGIHELNAQNPAQEPLDHLHRIADIMGSDPELLSRFV